MTLTADAFKEMGAATALDLVPAAVGGFPLVVKPSKQGSALGLPRSTAPRPWPRRCSTRSRSRDTAIVEKWIDGRELAVSVLDGADGPRVLPPVEIVAKSGLFDFSAMYTRARPSTSCRRVSSPTRWPRSTALAARVHALLGCRDMSPGGHGGRRGRRARSCSRCNTSPGMTETSLLPMAAEAAGMTFQDVVSSIVGAALTRRSTAASTDIGYTGS